MMTTTTMYKRLFAVTYKYSNGDVRYVIRPIIYGRVIDRIINKGFYDGFENKEAAEKWLNKAVTEDEVSIRDQSLWVAAIHRNVILLDMDSIAVQFVKRNGVIMAELTDLYSYTSRLVNTRSIPTEETRGL